MRGRPYILDRTSVWLQGKGAARGSQISHLLSRNVKAEFWVSIRGRGRPGVGGGGEKAVGEG